MAIDINDAISQLYNNTYYKSFDEDVKDILRESRFVIELDSPYQNKINLLANNVTFPRFDVITQKIPYQGRSIEKPIIKDISDKTITIDFYQDQDASLFSYFMARLNAVDKFNAYSGSAYNNYETMIITQNMFDNKAVSYKINFQDTFVKSVTPSKNATGSDELSILTVVFGFTNINVMTENGLLTLNDLFNIDAFLNMNNMDVTLNNYLEQNIHSLLGKSYLGMAIDNNFGDVLDNFIENFTGGIGELSTGGVYSMAQEFVGNKIEDMLSGIFK